MGEEREQEQGEDDGTINDPLVRTDVEAPRKPFGSDPEAED